MAKIAVRYVGLSDERIIKIEDVAKYGINLDRDLHWARMEVQVVDASPEFEEILRGEGHFQIGEYTDEGGFGAEISAAEDPERLSGTVVDTRTGARRRATKKE